jgi:hypothetical protein
VCAAGRVASHYYVHHESVDIYNKALRKGVLSDEELMALIAVRAACCLLRSCACGSV